MTHPLRRLGEGDADTLAAITGSVSQARWGVPKAIREQSLAIAARCFPGQAGTVAEFEVKLAVFDDYMAFWPADLTVNKFS